MDVTNTDSNFVTGRMFAIHFKIAELLTGRGVQAVETLSRGLDGIFGTPASELNRMREFSHTHLSRLHPVKRKFLQKLMAEVESITIPVNRKLTVDEKSIFWMGFQQQSKEL